MPGALPVDFEDHVCAGGKLLLNPELGGAVQVAEHLGVFEKFTPFQHRGEGAVGAA